MMQIPRYAALLAAATIALGFSGPGHADPDDHRDAQAIEHIRLLEQMLRDAGVDPPSRPSSLPRRQATGIEPIVPPSFASVVFETEVTAINERGNKAASAIKHVRRWLTKDDVKRRVAAQDIIEAVTRWAEETDSTVHTATDPVTAYILADDAINLLADDPLAKPFKQFVRLLQRDRTQWHSIVSMAAYQRALTQAEDIGLLGDWALIDFQNTNVRSSVKAVTAKLKLIANNWPSSDAAKAALANIKDWQAQEAQAIADLPAWRYTWQLTLIQTGTEVETTVSTTANGTIIIDEDQTAVYDPSKVQLNGTFQNTSDKPYRYTFVAGVTAGSWPDVPFGKLKKSQLSGFELIQTPLLQPGELHKWEAVVAVDSIRNLNRGGVTMVEIREHR